MLACEAKKRICLVRGRQEELIKGILALRNDMDIQSAWFPGRRCSIQGKPVLDAPLPEEGSDGPDRPELQDGRE